MPRRIIPERQPIGDAFTGTLIEGNGRYALSTIEAQDTPAVADGTLTIRYGVPYLGKSHLAIVPGLLALDYGDLLTGEEAWDFLTKRSNLHPRAEVFGYRNDGRDDMVVVKALDLAAPVQVFAYINEQVTNPIAQVNACITVDKGILPERLAQYLPHFPSIETWLQQDTDND